MITYYWCLPEEDTAHWKRRLEVLPEGLQDYILGRSTTQRQIQSTYGYWLLQQSAADSDPLDTISFTSAGQPIWPQPSTWFSISHSGGVVGLVLSTIGRIGLDIQTHQTYASSAVSPIFFSRVEQQAIQQATDPNQCLLQFWSKKEALIKAAGGTLLEWGNQTDVRAEQTIFQGTLFYWLMLPHPQNGVIWLASDQPFHHFSAKKWCFD